MNQTPYIGKRLELVSMDFHFQDISVALYQQDRQGRPVFLVHTYSPKEGAADRITSLVNTMKIMGGLESDDDGLLYFPCGELHEQAIKRIFLDTCKADPATGPRAHPLNIHDRKTGCDIRVTYQGGGMYQLSSDDEQNCERRVVAVTRGLLKLGQMEQVEESFDKVAFACGQAHDALIGMLLIRAPNVRAAIREAEMMASRGVLAAPASQG